MVVDLPLIFDLSEVCEACMKGKQQRQPFPQDSSLRTKSLLELVHVDLSRNMNTQAVGGSFYYFTLIDNYSRKTWVYFFLGIRLKPLENSRNG